MTQRSDPELVARALAGDAAAFGTLIERYKQPVYGVCVSLVRDFDLAQDMLRKPFSRLFSTWADSPYRLVLATGCGLSP